jgi:hypothetical protein
MRSKLLLALAAAVTAGPVLAHPHVVEGGNAQFVFLANAQNHAPFVNGLSCGAGDPAGYGLETAHHGPDAGTPGKGDGCYQVDGTSPALDVNNPVITNLP